MKHFIKVIFFLTLSLSIHPIIAQADEDIASEEELACFRSNSATFLADINNRINTLVDEGSTIFTANNKSIVLSKDDISLMAQIVYAESKGEPYDGKVGVASVILNRVMDPTFPNSVSDVVYQPRAFSCVVNGRISVTPTQECYDAVYDAISGVDPTNDALFFYNPSIATCSWMHNVQKENSKEIGNHLFFKTK